jgi:NDP-sugar pyrophosphorylase family protein
VTAPPAALVLTAGLGTRLQPLTLVRAKPAAPVAGVPLVARILRWLSASGVGDVVLNLHHRPETITAVVGHGDALGVRVRYSWEQPVQGSAGGPRRALPLLRTDPFLIVNGDTLTEAPLDDLVDGHARAGAEVTLAVVRNEWPDRYGGILADAGGAVTGFTRRGDPTPSWHFIGVQVASASVFAPLPEGVPAESVGGVYPARFRATPGSIRVQPVAATFHDIGTVADYLASSRAFAAAEGRPEALIGRRACLGEGATVADSVLWDDVRIGAGATLTACVAADGVVVPPGTVLERCALVPATADAALALPGARLCGEAIAVPY